MPKRPAPPAEPPADPEQDPHELALKWLRYSQLESDFVTEWTLAQRVNPDFPQAKALDVLRQLEQRGDVLRIEGRGTVVWRRCERAFARSDGFDNWFQMRTYRDFHYSLPFKGDLITWGDHPMLAQEPTP